MVQQKHDKNAALIDFGVALLENERVEHAARIFATSGLHVSSGKLEYFVERERRAKRADVLLNLFLNLSDGTKATTVDVNNLLLKLIPLFGAERDVNSIHRVQDKIRSVSFPVNEELRNCIEKNLEKIRQMKTHIDSGFVGCVYMLVLLLLIIRADDCLCARTSEDCARCSEIHEIVVLFYIWALYTPIDDLAICSQSKRFHWFAFITVQDIVGFCEEFPIVWSAR
ncbi:unnamed protein product [Anisakis simplex]|uniref:TPR_REGION domain-containing protein n=1 Tax=Anisakis simplex TaxID=6269 RepID=A0A0M3J1U9_ANISI|nr:unnamed protein product [Anisakis simplex]